MIHLRLLPKALTSGPKTLARMRHTALSLVLALLPSLAAAELCQTRVEAADLQIDPEVLDTSVTWRESLITLPSSGVAAMRGALRQCHSGEIYAFLDGLADMDGKCLVEADDDTGFVILKGERNYRGRCTKTVCQRVNDTKENLGAVTSSLVGGAVGMADTAATHPAGALVITGAADTIVASVGTASASALAVLSTPAVLAATTVSAVAVGGAVYICSE